jgi:glycosyltransferase involved in cell wall biosynthesis
LGKGDAGFTEPLAVRILLCNNRYFVSGGPERYLFSLTKLLETKGHEVIPFSVDYALNEPTPYSRYFVSAPINRDSVYYKEMTLSLTNRLRLFARAAYSLESKRRIQQLIRDVKPDVAYLLQICNNLSPSIIDGCRSLGVPVVMRLSDFNLICPAYVFLRDQDICLECERGYYRALRRRCLQNSFLVTAGRVLSMYLHDLLRVYRRVDAFITPSAFLRDKMLSNGFSSSRVVHIPSFIDAEDFEPSYSHDNYILYFGRVSRDKGLTYLIKAFENVARIRKDIRLLIVGNSPDGEKDRLEHYVEKNGLKGISFFGFKSKRELGPLIQDAMFTVVPSVWYENTPMTIYESFAYGKPVVASRIGSIPEQVDDGVDGCLYEPKNVCDLAAKMQSLLNDPSKVVAMGKKAREKIEAHYTAEQHYQRLLAIFTEVIRHKE